MHIAKVTDTFFGNKIGVQAYQSFSATRSKPLLVKTVHFRCDPVEESLFMSDNNGT
jgi:hypothetical protein